MVQNGVISQSDADHDPDRFCLTSVLLGSRVPEIDCRDQPLDLVDGDVLVVASDGLLILDDARIAGLVYENRDRPSAEISARLLQEIQDRDDPYQDNVSIGVIKVKSSDCLSDQSPHPVAIGAARRQVTTKRTTVQLSVKRKGNHVFRTYSMESEG